MKALLILIMLSMTGCATMKDIGTKTLHITGAMLQGAGQGLASNDIPEPKRQLECTPTVEVNGLQRVYDCH